MELKQAYNMFTDAWRFYKKYADVRSDDEFWENAIDESGRIAKQYENDRLCKDLLFVVLSELGRKEKELRKNAKAQ